MHLGAPFESFAGFKSYRLLRPLEGNTYKIYFGFASRTAYEDFKASDIFNDNFSKVALSQFFGASGSILAISKDTYIQLKNSNNIK